MGKFDGLAGGYPTRKFGDTVFGVALETKNPQEAQGLAEELARGGKKVSVRKVNGRYNVLVAVAERAKTPRGGGE